MIGTSYRGPVRRSVFHCVRRTQRAPDRGAAARSQGARTSRHFLYMISLDFNRHRTHAGLNISVFAFFFFFYSFNS
ncbi:unnamed protein product [Staurois parvus]|uniref:Uncharacterized protein n=1 Tax=Staurois parvus TaxID=386267 RepID=A0ABN9GHG1_9NEOB|nr:unnamed protein product [Staurois parvus]